MATSWNFLTDTLKAEDLIIDCRSQSAYEESTIAGAIYLPFVKKAFGSDPDSSKKLSAPVYSTLEIAASKNTSRIVCFDEGMGMFASRMTYLLRAGGFKEAYLLSKKWPFETPLKKTPGKDRIEPEVPEKVKPLIGVVDKAFMEKNLTRLQIFDARTREEYEGKLPRLTAPEANTLCGRLPGAFLWDWMQLYDSEGMIMEKSIFRKRIAGFPFMPERPTVIYDYNGARSCLLALMLKEFGYQEVYTYQGSWFEWRKSSLPKQAVSMFGANAPAPVAPRVGGSDRKKA